MEKNAQKITAHYKTIYSNLSRTDLKNAYVFWEY